MSDKKNKWILSLWETLELTCGLLSLLLIVCLLWKNGFDEITDRQLILSHFGKLLIILVLGQIIGVAFKLKDNLKTKNFKNKKLPLIELIWGICVLINYLSYCFYSSPTFKQEIHNILRFGYLGFALFPLLNLKEYFFRIARKDNQLSRPKISPAMLFLLSMLGFITLGGILLQAPSAAKEGVSVSFTDAFFISTSAVCVTGLTPINVHDTFTDYGQTILLILFQIGAFGVMTFTYFVSIMLGQQLNLRAKITFSNLLDEERITETNTFIMSIIGVTFIIEAIGAVGLYFSWQDLPGLSQGELWWYAIFHAVSGFCNAGFSLFSDNLASPEIAQNWQGQGIIMLLVICGGLGFAIYLESLKRMKLNLAWYLYDFKRRHPKPWFFKKWFRDNPLPRDMVAPQWSVHSWLVIRMTALLIFGGATLLFLTKLADGSLFTSPDPWYWNIWESLFNASTSRTAGFNMSDIAVNSVPYVLFLATLMFIGGNPGSTTGGVHTTTFAIACKEIVRTLRGQRDVVFHRKRVAKDTVTRALITVILAGAWVAMATITMCFIEPELPLQKNFFEVVSSFATVGFSLNVTPDLSTAGKWFILFNMVVGRVGIISFVLAFMKKSQDSDHSIILMETKIPLG